jgi:hypothetical protein
MMNTILTINSSMASELMLPRPVDSGGGARVIILHRIEDYRGIDFSVWQNGTLSLDNFQPFAIGIEHPMVQANVGALGYTLNSGATASFNYRGNLSVGGSGLRISLVPGARYRVVVIGDSGAYAVANVTAS